MIIGIRGRPAVGDVNVATTRRRRLERSLPPRTLVRAFPMILLIMVLVTAFLMMKLLTMFRLPDGRMRKERRRASQHARLQAQDRPLTDSARRAVLRIPRVITASRRPGAKRVPGRGVVHDELHIALNARPSTHPGAAGTLRVARFRRPACGYIVVVTFVTRAAIGRAATWHADAAA